jgi:hypothetical protein
MGQAADRLAERLHLPRGNALCRSRLCGTEIAGSYLDLVLARGTTSVCSYATIHPASVDAIFTAAQTRGMRLFAGKTCMDRNAPEGLRDTAQSAYDDSKRLLEKWHGMDRLSYVITPRFSPTSTPEQLAALGALWREYPDCLMQTHLSEQTDEIAWVQDLFPQSRDYLDTYEAQGLLREGAVYGHAIHLTAREKSRLIEAGASLIHCPTSNTFIGSGLFDMSLAPSLRVGLATDTGGGSSTFPCCAPWLRPMRWRNCGANRCTRRNCGGWRPKARPGRCGVRTGSAISPRGWRRTLSSSTWPRPPPSNRRLAGRRTCGNSFSRRS